MYVLLRLCRIRMVKTLKASPLSTEYTPVHSGY